MHSSGFITVGKQTHELIGRLDLFNDTLYLEPTEDGTKSLVYFKSDLDLDGLHNFSSKAFHRPHFQFSYRPASFFEQYRGKRNNEEKIVKNNRCEIKLVADYAFYRLIGNGNYANAARYLINLIERINVIFRDVDWGLSARGERLKNLGFTIKEMKIHERKNNLSSHFNYISPNRYANADQVLQSFSRTEGANTCITFLISGKVFDMGILGLANIGNVGEKRGVCGESNTNTGVVSVQRKSGLIITSVVDLVVAHEIGHLWGSNHDAIDDPRCVPTDSPEGRYIMHESSNSGYDRNNYRFSPCSKMAIHRVLYTAVDQCFVDEQKSLCGNNIVEAGEECDPGGQLLTGTAVHNDTCCTSQCKLKINAKCSPKHSECCTKDCSYLPATHLCQPSNKNNCSQPAFCTGYSAKCPEPKPVPDGTDCFDEGKCLSGKCIDFCHQISSSSSPCNCEKPKEMCMRCCRSPAGHCEPVKPVRYLVNGSICIHGRCNNKLCVKEVTDAATHFWRIIKDIRDNPSSEHLAHYIVFITICATLLVWGPCVACVMYNDRRKRRHRVRMAQPDDNFAKSGMSRSVSNPQNSKLL
ncbi:unnamed protein product [Bursaphelenchus okinawaensis]|uniref:Peptidase M12B domain-containing protein n=1 Tax=Bursaphelenchus okinawaensis TaxID=465554 RepID=A0A811LGU7_9BILA|nr:unnamed protein product [Bursaphelenchus okinawaensis]CAG9123182.1 unnamed protein product [Bursaphelenchus okinawaensis]